MSKSDRNLEALSAYLDGELPADERKQLEMQLEVDQDLQNWYEQLKRTRSMLRSTPALRAPRNYFLTPLMVGQKEKPRRAFPVLRFASAFAALLLALLFIGDMFVIPKPILAPSRAVQLADTVQEELIQPMLEAESFDSEPPAAPAEQLPPEFTMEGEAAAEAADENISSSMDSSPILEKVLPTQIPVPVEEAEEMLGGIAELEVESGQDLESREPADLNGEQIQQRFDIQSTIRVTEIGLLIIAISTGITAFYLYRKNQSL